jgi:predicted AlkP superfamily pyrophosphatase or phosphodiesterase
MGVNNFQNKKVIMLIIDTLMDSSIQAAIEKKHAPALHFFIKNGSYFPNLVSPFPTMSVTVDSTLLTGFDSDQHKVPGLVWYNQQEKRIVNYGSHVSELIKLGIKQSTQDIFYNLNHVHLNKKLKTIHEILQDKGIQTASISALIYRGNKQGKIKIPFLLSYFTGLYKELKTYSPEVFSYGEMHRLNPVKKNAYFWQKYGFNDKFSANELIYLISQNKLPALTIGYFPDLDQSVHKNGRVDIKGIQKVDKELQKILNQYDSWEDAINDNIWIILGDNGQAWIDKDKNKALIDLRKLLSSYKIVQLKKGVTPLDEIVLAVNQRMTFIYSLDTQKVPLNEIVKTLQEDERIDVIASKKEKKITVTSGIQSGEFHFHPQGEFIDEYGQSWHLEGNYEILDIQVSNNKIKYGEYPDALSRLYASLSSHKGDYIVVSAKPGHEFIGESSPKHVGGASHGGLHQEDTLVSMIVCGTNSTPKYLRTRELHDWLMSLVQ